MQAVDTNLLVYAEVEGSRHHDRAVELLRGLAEGSHPWAIPWPCVYEYLRVVTHPRVFDPPVPLERALADLEALLASPSLLLLHETPHHASVMRSVLLESRVTGNLIHDAHLVALCIENGVSEVLTGDRDLQRFAGISVVDPFA